METLGGPLFSVAGAGELHGPAITTIVFGCPPGLKITRHEVQQYLDRRRPGSNKHGTPRHETDKVLFLSGLFMENTEDTDTLLAGPQLTVEVEGKTHQTESYQEGYSTGEPISAIVLSTSKKSRHYGQFSGETGEVRPGHTDLVKHYKSGGFVDYRGGGRSSYRSTISDVIGGSIARLFLQKQFGTVILSSICQVGTLKANQSLDTILINQSSGRSAGFQPTSARVSTTGEILSHSNRKQVEIADIEQIQQQLRQNEIYTVDAHFANQAGELIKQTRIKGDSIGAAVEVIAVNVPPLVGEPLYNSLKLRLMGSLGGLHAARSCEVGAGQEVITRRGSENNDPIRRQGYQSNHHGGLLGGITTGNPLFCRVGFKPTSTIATPQQSIRKNLEEIEFNLQKGRHDPCVGVRAGVTLESRLAIELMNAVLMHQAQWINPKNFTLF
ncbi:chorismate synthase [Anaerolineales bacterium HSG24]|nr:chorismate synthase [Anaerolineales bacterium HSG24]